VAVGANSLQANTTGGGNVAAGGFALASNSIGTNNTAIGGNTLFNVTGSGNTALGASAGADLTTGSNNIAIGNRGVAGESGVIRIGTAGTQTSTYVAGVWQAAITGTAAPVRVNSSGKLGTVPSSARFKRAIQPMGDMSEAILALEPVSFRYKEELDPDGVLQFGLVAEEVAKVNPALVVPDEEGKPFSVRYEEVNAMLLNEFLKEHRKVAALEATVAVQQKGFEAQQKKSQTTAAEQQKEIATLTTALKAQAAQIQKVSDQLKTQAIASRVVADN